MAQTEPLVSVCIPTYNYRRYLGDALDSALTQEGVSLEVVVVDNCSDDGTQEFVAEYAARDPRIVYHRNSRNLGMTANFNRSMELARGKYIKFLCADDTLERSCSVTMARVLDSTPDVSLVACRRSVFDDGGHVLDEVGYEPRSFSRDGATVIRECYFRGNLIGEPTAVMFRKSDVVRGFDEGYLQALDMELWFRLLDSRRLHFLGEALCGVRVHDQQGTANNLRAGKITADKVKLFRAYAERPYLRGRLRERLRWDARMASSCAKETAAGATGRALAILPGLYFPRFTPAVLIPLATLLAKLRSLAG